MEIGEIENKYLFQERFDDRYDDIYKMLKNEWSIFRDPTINKYYHVSSIDSLPQYIRIITNILKTKYDIPVPKNYKGGLKSSRWFVTLLVVYTEKYDISFDEIEKVCKNYLNNRE